MLILGLSIALAVLGIFGIITFRQTGISNRIAIGPVSYAAARNFWIAFILGISLLAIAAVGLGNGMISAMPFMDMMEGEGDISGYANIIATFVNLFLSLISVAYIFALLLTLVIGIAVYMQIALLIYCWYCIKKRMYINKFYRYFLLLNSIVSLIAILICSIEIGSMIIAL